MKITPPPVTYFAKYNFHLINRRFIHRIAKTPFKPKFRLGKGLSFKRIYVFTAKVVFNTSTDERDITFLRIKTPRIKTTI